MWFRFRDDVFDRVWEPFSFGAWNDTKTSDLFKSNDYKLPSLVMQTSVTPKNQNGSIGFVLNGQGREPDDEMIPEFYLYMHFFEVKNLMPDETREFDIYINGTLWFGSISPSQLSTTTIFSITGIRGSAIHVVISPTQNSTLPPLLNAFEVYTVKHLPLPETHENDGIINYFICVADQFQFASWFNVCLFSWLNSLVDAITSIKLRYEISRNWQGDPCEPRDYLWEGLNCSYNGSDPPRITFLWVNYCFHNFHCISFISLIAEFLCCWPFRDLSSSGLTGEIDPHIQNLTLLENL